MSNSIFHSTILIIDDEQANVDLLLELLQTLGYVNVRGITDSRLSTQFINEVNPDLILLDLIMPYVNGFDILDSLHASNRLGGAMMVMVLTADTARETRERALKEGASDILTKPFDLTETGLRIRNLLMISHLMKHLTDQKEHLENRVKERTSELMTEKIRAEQNAEQVRALYDAVKNQNDSLRKIAWTQSHTVRAPLARILSLITLYRLGDLEEMDADQLFDIIEQSSIELDGIINDIVNKTHEANIT